MSAIYALMHDDTCIYVGRTTKTIDARMKQRRNHCFNERRKHKKSYNRPLFIHWRSMENKDDLKVCLLENCDKSIQKQREQHYINLLKPTCNGRNEIRQI